MTTVSLDHDDAGGGPPVVLVHGHPFDRSMWQPQLRSLAGRFRLVAPDLRGYGASASTPGIVSMSTLAGDVWSLLDDLGIETAAVVGRDGWSTAEVTGELVDCLSDPRVLTLPVSGTCRTSSARTSSTRCWRTSSTRRGRHAHDARDAAGGARGGVLAPCGAQVVSEGLASGGVSPAAGTTTEAGSPGRPPPLAR